MSQVVFQKPSLPRAALRALKHPFVLFCPMPQHLHTGEGNFQTAASATHTLDSLPKGRKPKVCRACPVMCALGMLLANACQAAQQEPWLRACSPEALCHQRPAERLACATLKPQPRSKAHQAPQQMLYGIPSVPDSISSNSWHCHTAGETFSCEQQLKDGPVAAMDLLLWI